MSDQDWIKALKPGDSVIATRGYKSMAVCVVEKITASGRVTLDNGIVYNPDGRARGGSSYSRSRLYEPTPELMAKVEAETLASKIVYMNREDVAKWSLSKLRTVWSAIEADDPDAKGDA